MSICKMVNLMDQDLIKRPEKLSTFLTVVLLNVLMVSTNFGTIRSASAQQASTPPASGEVSNPPTSTAADNHSAAERSGNGVTLRDLIDRYQADLKTLSHRFRVPADTAAHERRHQLLQQWLVELQSLKYGSLNIDEQVDYHLLQNDLKRRLAELKRDIDRDAVATSFLPYGNSLIEIALLRENVKSMVAADLASQLDQLVKRINEASSLQSAWTTAQKEEMKIDRIAALRAAEIIDSWRRTVSEMDRFYAGYDPMYSWWCEEPIKRVQEALAGHGRVIRRQLVGVPEEDKETIIGFPIGESALKEELAFEWIAHTPDELIRIAEREFAWCDQQGVEASKQLGFDGDWKKALEHVKGLHVEPGKQPEMIRDLAWEAVRFLETYDLVTVPNLAQHGWRMDMMSPERQRMSPYFLGGPTILVSFPTDTMTHEEKLMSLRSNNIHFSRATVQHELIPGHHLQFYMTARYRPYREAFSTPFWVEGWALYWEMLLWDLGFPQTPEDRIGMLFWRKHRCARIVFSLGYHLGKMTPQQCVDFLVDRVGHERSAAAAEVRRSIMGNYGPLYQAAYMLGGLQIRSMHKELVQGGQMTNRQFHDRILQENSLPIELLRYKLKNTAIPREAVPSWRFADPLP